MKIVYLHDDKGIFTGEYPAQESPLEKGVFIEPESSTDIAPPTLAANETAVFSAGAWTVVPDFRGATWFDQITGTEVEILEAGQPPATLAATAPPPTLAKAQADKVAELKAAYAKAIVVDAAFTNAAGVAGTFQCDANSVANLQAAISGCMGAQATPAGFFWVASDNTQVPFAYADLTRLAAVIFAQGAQAFGRLQEKKGLALAATKLAAVQAIVW